MEIFFLFALIVLAIPFVLPIVAWVSARRSRAQVETLARLVSDQQVEIDQLKKRVTHLTKEGVKAEAPAPMKAEAPVVPPAPAPTPIKIEAPAPSKVEGPAPSKVEGPAPPPAPPVAAQTPKPLPPPPPPAPPRPPVQTKVQEPPPPPPAPSAVEGPARSGVEGSRGFDWEGLVGVKLFSAIAGIALVFAAVFFLRYSIDAGWLQPPVRVAIGVIVAVALLVVCELKAARRYPVTANAMDAAAIAILFATFFAAHALWNLIPALVTFALLAVVTVVAVLLSIRRESLFIAVLGLLGGFATPALLSTGENRPIPLFAYLLLLNIGLAWVASSRRWPLLSWLTLVFTAFYQWGWVFTFLDQSSLRLAMGIFLVFPLTAVLTRSLGGVSKGAPSDPVEGQFEQSVFVSSVLPLLFAIYLAAVPAFGAYAALLFGFLLIIDLGLLALAIARQQEGLHGIGAVTTFIVMQIWLAVSYERSGSLTIAIAFTSAFVVIYLMAPVVASWFGRPLTGPAERAHYVAPALLIVFPMLASKASLTTPWPLAATLVALVILIAWRATVERAGALYFLAAFFAIAMQAGWSATHLTLDNLRTAVALYTMFGIVSLGVPIVARRTARPLQPSWGSGAVLLASLGLLLFLSVGPVAPAALWALALLLAILNAGLFIESATGRLPLVSQIGSVFSWVILVSWWLRAAGSVGVLPSLTVVVGLTLVTLFGHAWSTRAATADREGAAQFNHGLYLGLAGQLFLLLLVTNRPWALPPWPIFGALLVVTLGTTAAALWSRTAALHAAGCIASALVVTSWSATAGSPEWGLIAVLASALASAYALAWIPAGHVFDTRGLAAPTAAAVLFVAELTLILAVAGGAMPPFAWLVIAHVVNLTIILALTAHHEWPHVAVGAVAPAWLAVFQWQTRNDLSGTWPRLLWLATALYAVFVTYPFVLLARRRAREDSDPYLAVVLASAMAFFAGRAAFLAGDLEWMIGIVPVIEAAVLAVLLRALLRSEPVGQRDLGRLALVAGAALAFVTVAIPLQLHQQWITIGWALEGAALAWLYRRIPHRGLFYGAVALLGAVFVRLAMNPEVFQYEPRGGMRIFNWYLYTYLICSAALIAAASWLTRTNDRILGSLRSSHLLSAGGVILLFLLLNIEIADFYATGPTIVFRFGAAVSQDLTYTIGWLAFGMLLLTAGITLGHRSARIAAVALIAITTFKCFLYDLSSLAGLYRVASFVGLAISLALVSLALQKFVLSKPERAA
jgi:uncharacterized membrane protein